MSFAVSQAGDFSFNGDCAEVQWISEATGLVGDLIVLVGGAVRCMLALFGL